MKRALISVSDTTNLKEFAKELIKLGFELITTDGTGEFLKNNGIDSKNISDVTGFAQIMDGRVKTLHPKIYGGILCVRDNQTHIKELKENDMELIDLAIINLYPFKKTLLSENFTKDEIIEKIDIGGPSLIRACAKNHKYVCIVTDVKDYDLVLDELKNNKETTFLTRQKLAAKAFNHTASYDSVISSYLNGEILEEFPDELSISFEKVQNLRYGENPHQKAAFYKMVKTGYCIANSTQLHGKELSYNNIQDANATIEILKEFKEPSVVAIKHMNPCGVASANNIFDAWTKAYEADKISIFGGIVGFNEKVDAKIAQELSNIFLEVVIAPEFDNDALEILTQKKNIRILKLDMKQEIKNSKKITSVLDGILLQDNDFINADDINLECVSKKEPSKDEIEDLIFAYKVVKHVKSNAIVVVKNKQTIGIGAGQMNRIGSAKIALSQAKDKAKGAVLASDGFFPMPDTIQEASKYEISAVIQPGGSIRDEDSIKECDDSGISMVFTKIRHFKH